MDEAIKKNFEKMSQARTANQRLNEAKNQPHINQLLGYIWQTNELHILFADTGLGKSVIAVAIVDALTKGKSFIFLENENTQLRGLYYDFELSDRQFRKRYIDENGIEHNFSDNFLIDNIDFVELSKINSKIGFVDLLFQKIEYDLQKFIPAVLVIDNLTFLTTQSTQDTQVALDIMRRLNEIKKNYNLSILVLAHTPKRMGNAPITLNDMAGSKHLSNFSDSVSALGCSSKGKSIRYWKQIKPSRSGELIYDVGNVIILELEHEDAMLTMKFVGFSNEWEHLKEVKEEETIPDNVFKVFELTNKGLSYSEIANQLSISKGSITKWKNKYPQIFVSVSNVSNGDDLGNEETANNL
jgi:hypothetical protein